LDRQEAAAVVDFWDALEEANRIRNLGVWGMRELLGLLDRKEAELGRKSLPGCF